MIAQLYDPLGLLSPLTIKFKIFMQALWQEKIDWDDVISDSLRSKWISLGDDLMLLRELKIPRWLGYSAESNIEIHGFGDASKEAMCAVVYLRVLRSSDTVMNLVIAKTKVAPIKTVTIPRLELCAALLLSQLIHQMLSSMHFSKCPVHLWSDSTVALAWINSSAHMWQSFVSHRITEISRLVPNTRWHHVAGKQNPADMDTRNKFSENFNQSKL